MSIDELRACGFDDPALDVAGMTPKRFAALQNMKRDVAQIYDSGISAAMGVLEMGIRDPVGGMIGALKLTRDRADERIKEFCNTHPD